MVITCSTCGAAATGAWYPHGVKDDAQGRAVAWTASQYDAYTGPVFCSEKCRDAEQAANRADDSPAPWPPTADQIRQAIGQQARHPAGTPGTIESNGPAPTSTCPICGKGLIWAASETGTDDEWFHWTTAAARACEAITSARGGATDAEISDQLAGLLEAARMASASPESMPARRCGACHDCRTPGVLADDEMCDVIDADLQLAAARQSFELAADNTRALALSAAEAIEAARESGEAATEAAEAVHFAQVAADSARTRGGVALTANGYIAYPAPATGRHASA